MVGFESPWLSPHAVPGDRDPAPGDDRPGLTACAVEPPRRTPQGDRATPGARAATPSAHAPDPLDPSLLAHVQALGDMGWGTWDLPTGGVSWSEHMYVIFGRSPQDGPIGLFDLREHVDPADRATFDRLLHDVLGGRLSQAEFRVWTPRGARILRAVLDPLTAPVQRVYGVIQDVSRAAEERRLAHTLSDAILPCAEATPEVPGVRLAVRYLPAEQAAGLGGDWYQACPASRDRVLIAIGDISGHGREVIAQMARVRHALGGLGVTDAPPGQLLAWLNEMVWHSHDETTATALVGYLDPAAGEFTWAQAGHLPPVLAAGGSARLLEQPDGVLLGADPHARYGTARARLRAGDTLLLCTDGLVERPDRDIDEGLALLRRAAASLTGHDLQSDLNRLIDAVGGASPADDACLLAVRLPDRPH